MSITLPPRSFPHSTIRSGRPRRHPRWMGAAVALLSLLALEVLIRLFVGLGWLPYQKYPTSRSPLFWASIDRDFGVWRHPDTSFRHIEKCIDQVYTTSSVGARDRERSLHSDAQRRVVVLGDSYVEGIGIADGQRMTDLLEEQSGVEHLNFGSAGYFGTIQEWLVYRSLASQYDHSDVFVFLYPDNDFDDNSPEGFSPLDYRPYLRPSDAGFELYYTVEYDQRDTAQRSATTVLSNRLSNWAYTANVLRLATRRLREGEAARLGSRYDRFSDGERDRLLWSLDRIFEEAAPRRVYLFTIPSMTDWELARRGELESRLPRLLDELASSHSSVSYHDLLPVFLEETRRSGRTYRDLTLGCDLHWSPEGHALAARAVAAIAFPASSTVTASRSTSSSTGTPPSSSSPAPKNTSSPSTPPASSTERGPYRYGSSSTLRESAPKPSTWRSRPTGSRSTSWASPTKATRPSTTDAEIYWKDASIIEELREE